MSTKTRFNDERDTTALSAAEADNKKLRAELNAIRTRIHQFEQEIRFVQFPKKAPWWAPDWKVYLVNGLPAYAKVPDDPK